MDEALVSISYYKREDHQMGKEDQESSGFIIKDYRRFDAEGHERADSAHEEDVQQPIPTPKDMPKSSGATFQADSPLPDASTHQASTHVSKNAEQVNAANSTSTPLPDQAHGGDEEEVSFSSFVMSLATQALMQLGVVPPPEGYDFPKDVEGARNTIALLEMLNIKTKGNLTQLEASLLEDILHNVRLAFVKRG